MISDNDIVHKGLKKFWASGGKDKSGITAAHEKAIRLILVHLDSAQSLDDILTGLKNAKQLEGGRYSMEVNGNWRITFGFNQATNQVEKIYLEDLHGPGGARRF